VGPQPSRQGIENAPTELQLPEEIEGHESGRGIAAAPTQTTPHRYPLPDLDLDSGSHAPVVPERLCRLVDEIRAVGGNQRVVADDLDGVGAGPQPEHQVV